MTRTWYRIAVAQPAGPTQLYVAGGDHLGQAIELARHQQVGGWPAAVAPATGDDIPLGESVGRGHVVPLGAAPELPTFRWPIGVVPELAGAAALAGVRRGWTVRPDDRLLVIEVQPEEHELADVFLGLVERLPAADNLEVRVLDHFESVGTTDVWLTSRVNAKKILRFLDDHDAELFGNGHVELSIYVRGQRATLRLTEHKTVVWLAEARALEADIARWLGELHVPHVDALVTVGDAPHFHYRPAKSRDRGKLGEELYRQRLRKVDVVRAGVLAAPRETDG